MRRWKRARQLIPVYLFILPGMALFLIWQLYPLTDALVMSFFHWNLLTSSQFVGLENYQRALSDPLFWQSLRNVVVYTAITVPGQMILGLAAALLLDQSIRFRGVFRTLYYLPVITSWVVVSIMFTYLYNSQAGPLNYLLDDVLHIIPNYQIWLGDPNTALPSIATMGIWKGIGWNMVIFLAGLQSIPPDLYEAAKVDGAGAIKRFTRITLPLLRPTTAFLVVILVIGGLNTFIPVWIMTQGGPLHSTETVLTYMYKNAFADIDLGYGAAISYLFTLLIFTISVAEIRILRRRYEY
jgi:multiple sugar transport system permease protein